MSKNIKYNQNQKVIWEMNSKTFLERLITIDQFLTTTHIIRILIQKTYTKEMVVTKMYMTEISIDPEQINN